MLSIAPVKIQNSKLTLTLIKDTPASLNAPTKMGGHVFWLHWFSSPAKAPLSKRKHTHLHTGKATPRISKQEQKEEEKQVSK